MIRKLRNSIAIRITRLSRAARARKERRPGEFAGFRALLLEDNEINQRAGCGLLRKLGLTVAIAANRHEALTAVEEGCHDIIFLDSQVPGMDDYIGKPVNVGKLRRVLQRFVAPHSSRPADGEDA